MSDSGFSNWNHTVVTHPARTLTPATAEEILAALRDTDGHPTPVRASGHRHSLTACIEADGGTLVLTERLARIGIPDPEARTITVGAGVQLLDVGQALLPHWQLPVMPEIGNATAGSVACCGTKDSSLGNGPGQVSSAVVGLTVVTPGGIRTVTEAEHPAELARLRSSYGLLGIVVEVTFRIEPVRVIAFDYVPLAMDPLPSLADVRGGADGFLAFLEPHRRALIVERRTVTPPGTRVTVLDRLQVSWRSALWETGGSALAAALAVDHQAAALPGSLVGRLRTTVGGAVLDRLLRIGLDPLRFHARRADTTIDFEGDRSDFFEFTFWAFPVSAWERVVPEYLAFCDEFQARTGFRAALPTEIYAIARDTRTPLSVSQDEDVFTLDMVHVGTATHGFDPKWSEMNRAFNRFAAGRGGRPLFNQTKELDRSTLDEVRRRHPWFDAGCRDLASATDPRFRSAFFTRLLG